MGRMLTETARRRAPGYKESQAFTAKRECGELVALLCFQNDVMTGAVIRIAARIVILGN